MILLIGSVQGQEVPRGGDGGPLPVGKTVPAESKYESYRQDVLAGKQKMLEVLKGITDPASASAAVSKLEVLHEGMEASHEKHVGDMLVSVRDESRVKKRYEVQGRVIDTDLYFEISRLRVQGLLSEQLKETLNSFDSLGVFPEVAYATDPVMVHEQEEVYRRYIYAYMTILEEMKVVLMSVKDTASADAAAPRIAVLRDRQKKEEDRLTKMTGRIIPSFLCERVRMPDAYLLQRMENMFVDEIRRIFKMIGSHLPSWKRHVMEPAFLCDGGNHMASSSDEK